MFFCICCSIKKYTNHYVIRRQNYRNYLFSSRILQIFQLQGTRTKAINRKLREVEALPTDQAAALLLDMNEESVLDDE